MVPNGFGLELNEVRNKVVDTLLLLSFRFLADLLGRCLLSSFRVLVPNGTGLV